MKVAQSPLSYSEDTKVKAVLCLMEHYAMKMYTWTANIAPRILNLSMRCR